MKFKSTESNNCVSSSNKEPSAIDKKCAKSLFDDRAEPSAILDGTNTEHLEICDINPNFSEAGNLVKSR